MKVSSVIPLLARALLPKTVKRTVFLVTVFRALEKSRGVSVPRLDQLNEQLKLASNTRLLYQVDDVMPDVLKTECPITDDESLSKSCEAVLDWVPSWLKYGSRPAMVKDISRTVMCSVSTR